MKSIPTGKNLKDKQMNKNTKDEALKLALKSLEGLADYRYTERVKQALAAIREALEQPAPAPPVREQQEPDYSICPTCGGMASDPIVPPEYRHQSAERGEPVAWVGSLKDPQPHCVTDLKYCSSAQWDTGYHLKYIPLYTSPPAGARTEDGCSAASKPWVGLTDEHRREVINAAWNGYLRGEGNDSFSWHLTQVIEAKLREKNEHREKNA